MCSERSHARWTASEQLCLVILALVVGLQLIAWAAVPSIEKWHTTSQGENLTLAEAERLCVKLDLPAEAADIRFYQHLQPDQVVRVDFAIDEKSFLRWIDKNGWPPEKIVGGITIWPRACFGDTCTEIEVVDGYRYSTLERGKPNTFSVIYDRKGHRAYYYFDSEPFWGER